jgi:hypothetical protein
MVDNRLTRPIAGIAKANVVSRRRPEGGIIKRLMLLFDATTTLKRWSSMKRTAVYWIGLLAECGLFSLRRKSRGTHETADADGCGWPISTKWHGDAFLCSGARSAPHNIYTKKSSWTRRHEWDCPGSTLPVAFGILKMFFFYRSRMGDCEGELWRELYGQLAV